MEDVGKKKFLEILISTGSSRTGSVIKKDIKRRNFMVWFFAFYGFKRIEFLIELQNFP